MSPFALEQQPKESQLSIVYSDSSTTTLIFATRSLAPPLYILAMGIGCILFALYIIHFNHEPWDNSTVFKMMGLGCLCLLIGFLSFFGRYRIVVTPLTVTRSLHIVGFDILKVAVKFEDITSVACEMNKKNPVIRLYHGKEVLAFLEEFISTDERDWVAEGIRTAWHNAQERKQFACDLQP